MGEWPSAPGRPWRAGLARGLGVLAAVVLLAVVSRTLGGTTAERPGLQGDGRLRVLEATAAPVPPPVETPAATPSPPPAPPPAPVGTAFATWRELPAAPLAARSGHVAVWAGDRLIVWGGARYDPGQRRPVPLDDGAALVDGAWSPLPPSPLSARRDAAAAWTGRELLVWGGRDATGHRGDGAAYDPAAGAWRPLPPAPLAARSGADAVWTGQRAVVVGGADDGGPRRDVAAYDPAVDEWTAVAALPDPVGVIDAVAAAGGVVVWSYGLAAGAPITPLGLDDAGTSWRPLPPLPPDVRRLAGIVQGGDTVHAVAEASSPPVTRLLALPAPAGGWGGGRARPWEQRASVAGRPPADAEAHWTGAAVLVTPSAGRATSLLYDPTGDRWAAVGAGRGAVNAGGWSQTWTGRELLLWGGNGWLEGADPPQGRALRLPRLSLPVRPGPVAGSTAGTGRRPGG